MAGYFPIVLYCLKKILNYLSYSALFTQKWLKIHLVEKKLDPGRLASVCSEICFGLICFFFFFYDKTDTISRKKEGTRMKKNERGKNVFPCEKWSCRLKEWVCFIYFFFACDAKQMTWKLLHYCHMCENEGISAQPLLRCVVVGCARFCKSHMGNVYYFALNRSRYCVAVHSSPKKGKKGVKVNFEFFWKRNVFSWEKYLKAFKP